MILDLDKCFHYYWLSKSLLWRDSLNDMTHVITLDVIYVVSDKTSQFMQSDGTQFTGCSTCLCSSAVVGNLPGQLGTLSTGQTQNRNLSKCFAMLHAHSSFFVGKPST